jgi:serine/threonine-protein kinase MRCK
MLYVAIQVQLAKDKLDAARLEELTDSEETIAELKRRHEREKLLLLEDNKKLMMDLDTVSATFVPYNICVGKYLK